MGKESIKRLKKNFILHAVAIFFMLTPAVQAHVQQKTLLVATGPDKGLFHQTGSNICDWLNKTMQPISFEPIRTEGSQDNLQRLHDNLAELAIVQRDTLLDFYYDSKNPYKNFKVILPLYQEALQIFVENSRPVLSFKDFFQMLQHGNIQKFYIGPPGTTSNTTIRCIMKLFGVEDKNVLLVEDSIEKSIENFQKNPKGTALATIMGVPVPWADTLKSNISLVSMNPEEECRITAHIENAVVTKINDSDYPFLHPDSEILTIGTWALLVGQSSILDYIESESDKNIVKVIVSQSCISKNKSPLKTTFSKNGVFSFLSPAESPVPKPSVQKFSNFFRGLPLCESLRNCFNTSWRSFSYLVSILLMLGVVLILIRNFSNQNVFRYWKRSKHIVLSALFILAGFLVLSKILVSMEASFCGEYSLKSPLLYLDFFDIQHWLLVFALTGYDNGIFPISNAGQYLATASHFIGWFAAAMVIVSEFVFNIRRRKRLMGNKHITYKNHIVIGGWNETVPNLIKNAQNALSTSFIKPQKIVNISPVMKDYISTDLALQNLHARGDFDFVHGDIKNMKIQDFANISEANTIVLISEDKTIEADERNLLRALSISKHLKEANKKVYVISELNSPHFKQSLFEADVNEVICGSDLAGNLIIESALNHGVASILNEILFYNDGNEFYIVDIKKYNSLAGKTFDELLGHLRKSQIQLVGIKIVFPDKMNREIINRKKIDEELVRKGLKRQFIVNPTCDEEINYKTSLHDQLIVFSLNEENIKKIRKLKI